MLSEYLEGDEERKRYFEKTFQYGLKKKKKKALHFQIFKEQSISLTVLWSQGAASHAASYKGKFHKHKSPSPWPLPHSNR